MRDKRPVDELSIEELERILAIRKREERMKQVGRMQRAGRVLEQPPPAAAPAPPRTAPDLSAVLNAAAAPANPPPAAPRPAANGYAAAPSFEDEEPAPRGDSRFWRSFVNQALLLVEVAAVIGLLVLGYQMITSINTLDRESAAAAAAADLQRRELLPTLAPTPQLQLNQIVLPGGHTPPTAPGGARFNYEEIPAALRDVVAAQIAQPISYRPPPTDETPLALSIPKLNVDQTIVQGTDWEALKLGIGQLLNGATPADNNSNVVLSAHNDIYGEIFRHLDQLEPGDEFFIRTRAKVYRYVVSRIEFVKPTDVHVLEPRGGPTVTLISCYPYQVNTQRIVVFADRASSF